MFVLIYNECSNCSSRTFRHSPTQFTMITKTCFSMAVLIETIALAIFCINSSVDWLCDENSIVYIIQWKKSQFERSGMFSGPNVSPNYRKRIFRKEMLSARYPLLYPFTGTINFRSVTYFFVFLKLTIKFVIMS